MAWKKIIVGSEAVTGALLPGDLTSNGDSAVAGSVLSVQGSGSGITWVPDETYTHPTHVINGGNPVTANASGTGAEILNSIAFNLETDGLGHVTDASASAGMRTLTLANLGYTGHPDANNYSHPIHPGDDIDIDESTTGAEVISGLTIALESDTLGHVTHAEGSASKRTMTLAHLGYTGSPSADAYSSWELEINGTAAQTVNSQNTLDLVGGSNITFSSQYSNDRIEVEVNAAADYVGHIQTVEAGLGMDFTTMNSSNPNGEISLGTPSTISATTDNQFQVGEDGAVSSDPATATSHNHRVLAYSDGTSNFGNLLKSDDAGGLKLTNLQVTNSLTVDGTEIVLGSDNLTIEDAEVQINWDPALNAGAGGYGNNNSAIIFGHPTAASGGKIINTPTYVSITDIPAGEVATGGGTVAPGNAKKVLMGDLTALEISCEKVQAVGDINTAGALKIDKYAEFASSSAPTAETGRLYFDGSDYWVNI